MCLGAKQEEDEEKAQELILRVETMSSALQKTTDESVSRLGESMEKRYNTLNASLIELAANTSSRSTAIETKLEGRVENVEKHISTLEKKLTAYLDVRSLLHHSTTTRVRVCARVRARACAAIARQALTHSLPPTEHREDDEEGGEATQEGAEGEGGAQEEA
jgi:uncharacterized membrane protein YgaE (UPF0421/DUF939 family)